MIAPGGQPIAQPFHLRGTTRELNAFQRD